MKRQIGAILLSILGIAVILIGIVNFPPGDSTSVLFLIPGILIIVWARNISKMPPKE